MSILSLTSKIVSHLENEQPCYFSMKPIDVLVNCYVTNVLKMSVCWRTN